MATLFCSAVPTSVVWATNVTGPEEAGPYEVNFSRSGKLTVNAANGRQREATRLPQEG
jgi:hypothetical protein